MVQAKIMSIAKGCINFSVFLEVKYDDDEESYVSKDLCVEVAFISEGKRSAQIIFLQKKTYIDFPLLSAPPQPQVSYGISQYLSPSLITETRLKTFSNDELIDQLTCHWPSRRYFLSCEMQKEAQTNFGTHFWFFGLYPDVPVSTWMSTAYNSNFLWAPRLLNSLYSIDGKAASKLYNVCIELQNRQLVRKILMLGVFLLPSANIYHCPAPQYRFCFDFRATKIDFFRSRKARRQQAKYRISINRSFNEALRIAAAHHKENKGATWITDDLIDILDWFRINETPDNVWCRSNEEVTARISCPMHIKEKKVHSFPKFATRESSVLKTEASNQLLFCDSSSIADSPMYSPLIQIYSFELWDVESRKLAAAIFTYVIGRIACDFTCVTIKKDNSSCGALLTKAVGEILQKAGIYIWYWGFKLDYMDGYLNHYGGKLISAEDFYEKWFTYAIGCSSCFAHYIPMKHRRSDDTSSNFDFKTRAFLCYECFNSSGRGAKKNLTISQCVNTNMKSLDFEPIPFDFIETSRNTD